jgi:hypothetical protein
LCGLEAAYVKLITSLAPILLAVAVFPPGVEHIVVVEKKPVLEIRGVVFDPSDSPIPHAKVELYDHPEVWTDATILTNWEERTRRQHKLREFVTKEDGKFRLQDVEPGKYELRLTYEGFNTTSIIFTLAAPGQKASRDALPVHMHLST